MAGRHRQGPTLPRPDLQQGALAGFQWPAPVPISGVYGGQRFYSGTTGNPRFGVDMAVPTLTPVRTPRLAHDLARPAYRPTIARSTRAKAVKKPV
jgi:murein DD-endopeptidase MepM/ murein hydrolase activator NlpD